MLELSFFTPLLGERFVLRSGEADEAGAAHPTALIEARALEAGIPRGLSRQPFSLTFEGPAAPVLPQCIYRLEHPALEPLDLFLVPIGQSPGGVRYEAVFT